VKFYPIGASVKHTATRMKRRSRIPPRSTKRKVHDGFAEHRANSLKNASTLSEDQVRGSPDTHIPLSLKTGAGRQYWDEVLRLLVKIRTDCDAAAERLGYVSSKDYGLAAVEYIANKILEAVRGERQQQIVSSKREAPTKPPESSKLSLDDYKTAYKTVKPLRQASCHSERTKWIDELKQILRNRKTKSGLLIDSQLAHEIAKQITILNEGMARPETPESIKQMRQSVAPFFANRHGSRKKASKGPRRSVPENVKRKR
jgi:hypothetical protein